MSGKGLNAGGATPEISDRISASAKLLNRLPPKGYREQQTKQLAAARQQHDGAQLFSAIIFRLGQEWLALPAGLCQQVLCPLSPHWLPHRSNATLLGVVNVHGQLLLKVSLLEILSLPQPNHVQTAAQIDAQSRGQINVALTNTKVYPRMIVVKKPMETGEVDTWAFDVDELYGIHAVAFSELAPAAGVAAAGASCARYVFAWRSQQVSFLDDVRLFEALRERSL